MLNLPIYRSDPDSATIPIRTVPISSWFQNLPVQFTRFRYRHQTTSHGQNLGRQITLTIRFSVIKFQIQLTTLLETQFTSPSNDMDETNDLRKCYVYQFYTNKIVYHDTCYTSEFKYYRACS